MSPRKIFILFGFIFSLLLWGSWMPVTQAQQPRPTPTRDTGQPTPTPILPATNTPVPAQPSSSVSHGTIQGIIYQDVNGDGQCMGTGIAGEDPVAGVDIEFVSSDKQHVITLYTGEDGRYGLAAAGFSYWEVTVKPTADWVVTSAATLYAPISEDNRAATDVNFCLQAANRVQTTQTAQTATVLLPDSGGQNATPLLNWALFVGILFVVMGLVILWRQRSVKRAL